MTTWITLVHGEEASLGFLADADFNITHLSHSLSQLNRFNGHALRPVCQAEHALLVVDILEKHLGITSPCVLLAGLLYDAHDAFLGMPSIAMKHLVRELWALEERRVQRFLFRKYMVWTAYCSHTEVIREARTLAKECEHTQLMARGSESPQLLRKPLPSFVDLGPDADLTWHDWNARFLDRFAELDKARNQLAVDATTHA